MSYDADRAIKKAKHIAVQYGEPSAWALAERLAHVFVNETNLGGNIRGYSMRCCRETIIALDDSMTEEETTAVLYHEIGHALLTQEATASYFYQDASRAAVGSSEYIANCFMFQMLFGNRGAINPMNYIDILDKYGLPHWMTEYFGVID